MSSGLSSLDILKVAFKGDLVVPSDLGYNIALKRWAVNAERDAKVVAFVKDAEDVSAALKFAREHELPVAIRGGGHSCSGASSAENGLVIDLSKYLNGCEVDVEKRIAKVGGGAIWATVDKEAIAYGLATPGGTVNHTGVGGLVLGGGYGFLSGEHGLAIDNIVQATVVTADGSVLLASLDSNEDLFWGIRGAGSNFGVVTEFVLKLHEQRKTIFSGMVVFPPYALEGVFNATEGWRKVNDPKSSLLLTLARGPDGNHCIVVTLFYNGSTEEGKTAFKSFFDLNPVVDKSGEIPFEVLNSLSNPTVEHGQCRYISGKVVLAPSFLSWSKLLDKVIEVNADGTHEATAIIEYYSPDKMSKVPSAATAFQNRVPHSNILLSIAWQKNTQENLQRAKDIASALSDAIDEVLQKPANGATYGNYNSEEAVTLGKTKSLFGDNYTKLQAIKKRYDPDMIFNKWFPVPPA